MLTWSMRHRWVISLIALLVMISIVPLFMMVGKTFIPIDDQSEFEINVRTPVGSSLEGTSAVLRSNWSRRCGSFPASQHMLADRRRRTASTARTAASITVELKPMDQRQLKDRWRS